jgi:hypothetical protein
MGLMIISNPQFSNVLTVVVQLQVTTVVEVDFQNTPLIIGWVPISMKMLRIPTSVDQQTLPTNAFTPMSPHFNGLTLTLVRQWLSLWAPELTLTQSHPTDQLPTKSRPL